MLTEVEASYCREPCPGTGYITLASEDAAPPGQVYALADGLGFLLPESLWGYQQFSLTGDTLFRTRNSLEYLGMSCVAWG